MISKSVYNTNGKQLNLIISNDSNFYTQLFPWYYNYYTPNYFHILNTFYRDLNVFVYLKNKSTQKSLILDSECCEECIGNKQDVFFSN